MVKRGYALIHFNQTGVWGKQPRGRCPRVPQPASNPIMMQRQDARSPCRARTPSFTFRHVIGANGTAPQDGAQGSPLVTIIRGGGGLIILHGRSRMTIDSCIPARTEHVGFSPTRQISLAPSAKRREVFGESHEG